VLCISFQNTTSKPYRFSLLDFTNLFLVLETAINQIHLLTLMVPFFLFISCLFRAVSLTPRTRLVLLCLLECPFHKSHSIGVEGKVSSWEAGDRVSQRSHCKIAVSESTNKATTLWEVFSFSHKSCSIDSLTRKKEKGLRNTMHTWIFSLFLPFIPSLLFDAC
jgi:hypothetical protein